MKENKKKFTLEVTSDGEHYFECICSANEHRLRFALDRDEKELYTSVFLNDWPPWYGRLWRAARYVFGYKCRFGHWDCWVLRKEDAGRLIALLNELAGLDHA